MGTLSFDDSHREIHPKIALLGSFVSLWQAKSFAVSSRLEHLFGQAFLSQFFSLPGACVRFTNRTTDEQLVEAIGQGSKEALALLYDRYATLLMGMALHLLKSEREAEDLIHDVFLEIWQKSTTFDPIRGGARNWILLRLRSRALDRRKSISFARTVRLDGQRELTELLSNDDPSLRLDFQKVRDAMKFLAFEQQEVIALAYFDGLSSSEMAEHLHIPIGTVKSRMAAAMGRLRAFLCEGAHQ